MSKMLDKIVIIGSGNVSWHFAKRLSRHFDIQVLYRKENDIQAYFRDIKANFVHDSKDLWTDAILYIICVDDDKIESVLANLPIISINQIVAHTSGTVGLDVLSRFSNRACIWPIQSLTRCIDIKNDQLPLAIVTNHENTQAMIHPIVSVLSPVNHYIAEDQKPKLHLAAIIINNFVNHLIYQANRYCEDEHIPIDLLFPLMKYTLDKMDKISPYDAQTGPARRGDQETIDKHIELLRTNPNLQNIFKVMSSSILNTYKSE